jgi:hypothetical protein
MPRGRPRRPTPFRPGPGDEAPDDEAQDEEDPPHADDDAWGEEPDGPEAPDDEPPDEAFDGEDEADDLPPREAERPRAPGPPPPASPTGRRRGRQPNAWPPGLGAADLEAYRARFRLSEQRLADYLGVSLPTLRSWTKGGRAPGPDRVTGLRALLARDYVAPAGAPARRSRAPRLAPGSAPTAPAASTAPIAPARDPAAAEPAQDLAPPPAAAGPALAVSPAAAIAELAAAYLRTPGGQHLTPAELIDLIERIRRALP